MVADFGIARAMQSGGESLTQTACRSERPAYMSPSSQASGERNLECAPLMSYALGCVLYEMLAGEPPVLRSGRRRR